MADYIEKESHLSLDDAETLYDAEFFAREIGAARDSFYGEYDIMILEAAESVEMRIYDALCALRSGEELPDTESKLIFGASTAWNALCNRYIDQEVTPGNPADLFNARERWIVDRAGAIA
ncbi:hypothetical protein FACS18948_6450 [Clostridia bacterium]|nr:hypothetical protein FACS18948_6450 [Clostridia bacterium]